MNWISIKDRLPEDEGFYMTKTYVISMTPKVKIEMRYFRRYKNHLGIEVPSFNTMSDERVSHWSEIKD